MNIEEIYEEYFDEVYTYVHKLTNDNILSDDIVNETFFSAMENIEKVNQHPNIIAWLKTVAKHRYYNKLREFKYISLVDNIEDVDIAVPDRILDNIIVREEAIKARELLHQLPEHYKEVYMWRAFVGLRFKEIDMIFGMTEGWACTTYYRAKTKLLKAMNEENK